MADDIDIEEHNLLENPKLRTIFPDLSVLKKEVIDFDEEEMPEKTNSVQNGVLNDHLNNHCTDMDILITKKLTHYECGGNRIVQDKKDSEECLKAQCLSNNTLFPKVVLKNLGPYLGRSKSFCRICLVLFSNQMYFNKHNRIHSNSNYSTKQDNRVNMGNMKTNKCDICNCEFSTYGNLKKHERNLHSINKGSKNNIPEDDVMVKIDDSKENDEDVVSFKVCFHCDMQFLTQQDLIDHLYDVLNNKNTQVKLEPIEPEYLHIPEPDNKKDGVLSKHIDIPDKIKKEEIREVSNFNNIYSCPICSYYFSTENFYIGHVLMKHKVIKKTPIDKVAFNPMCKFCHLKFVNVLSYNTHLRKNHKNEIIKEMTIENSSISKLNIFMVNKDNEVLKNVKDTESISETTKNMSALNVKSLKIMISKIILFECLECHVHFLTNRAAIQHYNHSTITKNWKCTSCNKILKEVDAIVHKKQHELSDCFSVNKVIAEFQPTLYKCPTCAIHYSVDRYVEHISVCETQQPISTYCRFCDILIEPNIKIYHEDDHYVKKNILSDFKIIELQKTSLKNNKNVRKYYSKFLNKPETVVLSDSAGIDLDNIFTLTNREKNDSGVNKKHLLSLNYCKVCKCNEARNLNRGLHRREDCMNIIKYTCKLCGLIFSKNSITSHKRLHYKHERFKLQDLTFYDIKSNNMIKPPMPDLPKCKSCGKHFIWKYEVTRHSCFPGNHITCHICRKMFSESAYKLHMPFHRYKIKINQYCVKSKNEIDSNNLKEVRDTAQLKIIYTCKNCDLSMNTYDESIGHCHSHKNLNEIDASAILCVLCQIRFESSCYKAHRELHKVFETERFQKFSFDVFHFGTSNNEWLRHVFGALPKNKIDKYIKDSIYKYENRIHMDVLQNGPSDLTVYKCGKCECVIDCYSIYAHISSCTEDSEAAHCSFCSLTFTCRNTKYTHEKLHRNRKIDLKSYKIVIFNRDQDLNINCKIRSLIKSYSVYECRYCHVLVEKDNYGSHICFLGDCKKCNSCGLLINAVYFKSHTFKHKQLKSFNENQIKVVLIGNKLEEQNNFRADNVMMPTFSGIVCDYTFYKCVNCNVCVRDFRGSVQHYCLISAAKSECPKCYLIFDEGKLKGHLKLHDTDPDFLADTIRVQSFNNCNLSKIVSESNKNLEKEIHNHKDEAKANTFLKLIESQEKKNIKLYKCSCGLHYMEELSLIDHKNKCSGKNKRKQGNQTCSKCGLVFSPNILFKHLIEHHGNKNIEFKFEIVDSA